MRTRWTALAAGVLGAIYAFSLLLPGAGLADELGYVVTKDTGFELILYGQYRARFEYDQAYDFTRETQNEFISHRARFAVKGLVKEKVGFFFQAQDVRTWGDETGPTDGSSTQFDLHQGYGQYFFNDKCSLRLGRQELVLANERLVGNWDWLQTGQSFDAATYLHHCEMVDATVFYAKIREESAGYPKDGHLTGFTLTHKKGDAYALTATYLFDHDDDADQKRHTLGFLATGSYTGLGYRGEGYYQAGERGGSLDISAFMFSLGLDYKFDAAWKPKVGASFDYLSGDNDATDDQFESFDTLYGSNSNFYGYQDLFLDFSPGAGNSTGELGLNDAHLFLEVTPAEKLILVLDGHYFMLAEENSAGDKALGTEFDLTVTVPTHQMATFSFGYSIFLPDTAMETLHGVHENDGKADNWLWAMADFKF